MLVFKTSQQLKVVFRILTWWATLDSCTRLCACAEDGESWVLASLSKTIVPFILKIRSWESENSEFLTTCGSVYR